MALTISEMWASPCGRLASRFSILTRPPIIATAATMKEAELKSAGTEKSAARYSCPEATSNSEYPFLRTFTPKCSPSLSVISM